MSTISIVVPVYKVEPYLRECIDSILSQTYNNFDLILVDDGSTDACGVICDKYSSKDRRIFVIHQQNGGLSAARNAGIGLAFDYSVSKWITFVDSDDYIFSDYLEYLLGISQHYQADVVACSYKGFSQSSNITTLEADNKDEDIQVFSSTESCMDVYSDFSICGITACGKLFRKVLFEDVRFPVGKIHEDDATVPILLYKARIVVASHLTLYCYRFRADSIMNKKFSKRRFDGIEAMNGCIAFFAAHKEDSIVREAQRRKRITLASYNLLAIRDRVHNEVPKKYKMSEISALKLLRKELPDSKYTYQLAQIHPSWIRPHEYLRKIKKILHIPCK